MEEMIDDPRPDMTPRLSPELAAAMKAYYDNRAADWAADKADRKWDKQADLDRIFDEAGSLDGYCMASVGHFTIDWADGTRTEHDEKDYLEEKVYIVKDDDGVYWRLRDHYGEELPEPERIKLRGE